MVMEGFCAALKVWLALISPGDSDTGPVQVKSDANEPVPMSWRDCPAGVELVSLTPISVEVNPIAGPFVAVSVPS